MFARLQRQVRAASASRSGSAAAEFVLIAPLLFAMLYGVIEAGFIFYGYGAMQLGANQAARAIAVNKTKVEDAATAVNAAIPRWMKGVKVTAVRKNPAVPLQSLIEVTVTAPSSGASPIHGAPSLAPFTMTTRVSVKQELPYDN